MKEYANVVSSREILDSKERRVMRQRSMISDEDKSLISFTLNIAGHVKCNPIIEKCFIEGIRLIENQLKRRNIKIIKQMKWIERTGCEAMFAVDFEAIEVKHIMISIEEGSTLGRIFDIDVISKNGHIISRSELGISSRRCLVCDHPAKECIRSQRHELHDIEGKINSIINEYFILQRADSIAAMACRSLMYELLVTPKPGLVDRNNNGAHTDMDVFTFADSISVLAPYFRKLYLLGNSAGKIMPEYLLEKLRFLGIQAEDDMICMTDNVNTHKGAIFSLGLLCAALGWGETDGQKLCVEELLEVCGKIAKVSIHKDLKNMTIDTATTMGEKLYIETGNSGARSEAAAGFPSVSNYGLPFFKKMIKEGKSINDAGVYTLLVLISQVTDTNIISRRSYIEHRNIQKRLHELLNKSCLPSFEEIKELDSSFIKSNVSPGGCADLLALTLMLYFLEKE